MVHSAPKLHGPHYRGICDATGESLFRGQARLAGAIPRGARAFGCRRRRRLRRGRIPARDRAAGGRRPVRGRGSRNRVVAGGSRPVAGRAAAHRVRARADAPHPARLLAHPRPGVRGAARENPGPDGGGIRGLGRGRAPRAHGDRRRAPLVQPCALEPVPVERRGAGAQRPARGPRRRADGNRECASRRAARRGDRRRRDGGRDPARPRDALADRRGRRRAARRNREGLAAFSQELRRPAGIDRADGKRAGRARRRAGVADAAHRLPRAAGPGGPADRVRDQLRAHGARPLSRARRRKGRSRAHHAGARAPRRGAGAAHRLQRRDAALFARGRRRRDEPAPHRAEAVRRRGPHPLGRRARVLDHHQHQRLRAACRPRRLRAADAAPDDAAAAQRDPGALAVGMGLLRRRIREHARLGLALPRALRLAADGRHLRAPAVRRTGHRRLLPRRARRVPHRVQRRLRDAALPGETARALGDRGFAAGRGGVARRQPVLRPVGLRVPGRGADVRAGRRGSVHSHYRRGGRMRNRKLHAALYVAMGMSLASALPMQGAFAANADGSLAGRLTEADGKAATGIEVTVQNPETGFTRTVAADADGNYTFQSLPVGTYTLEARKDGKSLGKLENVAVGLGIGTTADVVVGAATLEAVEVLGTRMVHAIDVSSTESATNVTREELDRLPVERDVLSVALLAPGLTKGDNDLGEGVSFGGSSIAENSVYINGLNVTDFYNRVGASTVPYAFYEEFQVKTGGYSVEFGRTTGGVINAVTRSGTNEFDFGTEIAWEPSSLQSSGRDSYDADGNPIVISRYDEYDRTSTTLY